MGPDFPPDRTSALLDPRGLKPLWTREPPKFTSSYSVTGSPGGAGSDPSHPVMLMEKLPLPSLEEP